MYRTFEQRQRQPRAKIVAASVEPVEVDWRDGGTPAVIHFRDGSVAAGSCIRCPSPPCMEYSHSELDLKALPEFPYDRDDAVCPTGAIRWPVDASAPAVDPELCISCGLCASRCPVWAIHVGSAGAYVNDLPNEYFREERARATAEVVAEQASRFRDVRERGSILRESEPALLHLHDRIVEQLPKQGAQFPNHLARNLFLAIGVGAAMRRRGDTNVRMDLALGPPGLQLGTAEVEFASDLLEAPRSVLDNVAVLVSRYAKDRTTMTPFIVSLALPNQRSEYWQVLKDIREALSVRINSVTIGALAILLWNRALIRPADAEAFYLDTENPSLRPAIEEVLGRELDFSGEGYRGLLASAK